MTFKLADRVKQTATSTGTGSFTLSATPTGYRAFSSVLSVNDTLYYTIAHQTANEWEVGYGVYSGTNTLDRVTVISSSNSGSVVNFTTGTKDVFITLPAYGGSTENVVLGSSMTYDLATQNAMTLFGYGINTSASAVTVVGNMASASSDGVVAVGQYSNGSASGAVAIGRSSRGSSDGAVGIGDSSVANGQYSIAIGASATANGQYAVSLGVNSYANNIGAVAIGGGNANQDYAVAIGNSSFVFNSYGTAVGAGAQANNYSVSLGYYTQSSGSYGIAIGASSTANSANSISIGNAASLSSTSYDNSIAIGASSTSTGSYSLGIGGSTSTTQYGIALGDSAVATDGTAQGNIAIGAAAQATGYGSLAIGRNAQAVSYGQNMAIGYGTQANAQYVTAVGYSVSANYDSATVFGSGASVTGTQGNAFGAGANASQDGIAIGRTTQAQATASVAIGVGATVHNGSGDGGIAIGYGADVYTGAVIGYNAAANFYTNTTVIGDNLMAVASNATFMNRFRTGVTPMGTSWYLKWDDSSKEVYADAGPGPAAATWYTYQDNDGTPNNLNLAVPSGAPSSGPGFNTTYLFGSMSPSNPSWSYQGNSGGGVNNVYSTSTYPIMAPINGGPYFGQAICYYTGPEADAGSTSSINVATGTSPYSSSGSNLYMYGGFPVFGSSRTGHYIACVSGNFTGQYVASSGCTLSDEFYDSNSNYTFFFIDLDATAVSNLSSGMSAGYWSGFASYQAFFWYTYA